MGKGIYTPCMGRVHTHKKGGYFILWVKDFFFRLTLPCSLRFYDFGHNHGGPKTAGFIFCLLNV